MAGDRDDIESQRQRIIKVIPGLSSEKPDFIMISHSQVLIYKAANEGENKVECILSGQEDTILDACFSQAAKDTKRKPWLVILTVKHLIILDG